MCPHEGQLKLLVAESWSVESPRESGSGARRGAVLWEAQQPQNSLLRASLPTPDSHPPCAQHCSAASSSSSSCFCFPAKSWDSSQQAPSSVHFTCGDTAPPGWLCGVCGIPLSHRVTPWLLPPLTGHQHPRLSRDHRDFPQA